MNLPQPYESVTGVRRTRDDLLSLTEPALRRRVIMLRIARELWTASLRGAGNDYGREKFDRMLNPEIGDLVAETGATHRPDSPGSDGEIKAVHGFGILLGERNEWTCSHVEWAQEIIRSRADGFNLTDDDRATTMASYIQYGPEAADVCRWTNAELYALPTGLLYHIENQRE